jgi:flagella basal body P-ring formation protein FlgA
VINLQKLLRTLELVFVLLALATPALAAEIVLRERSTHDSGIVRLGDIADIAAASTGVVDELATTPLLAAPAPGRGQYLTRNQVYDLLTARGINLQNITLGGATIVEIGEISAPMKDTPRPSAPLTLSEARLAAQQAIAQFVQTELGLDQFRVELQASDLVLGKVADLGREFSVHGGRPPWLGRQEFVLGKDRNEVVLWANVIAVTPLATVVREIERGDLIRADDVALLPHEGSVPNGAIRDLDEVVGTEAMRMFRPDALVLKAGIRAPRLVERGETVSIVARTGGVAVKTFGVARQAGALGDLIQVESLDTRERFAARVAGRSQLEVMARGATTAEFANPLSPKPLRR